MIGAPLGALVPAAVLDIQRLAGNKAARTLVVQRLPGQTADTAQAAQPAGGAQSTGWVIPFKIGTALTNGDAVRGLERMEDVLLNLKEAVDLPDIQRGCDQIINTSLRSEIERLLQLKSADALSGEETDALRQLGKYVADDYRDLTNAVKKKVQGALENVKARSTSAEEAQVAEELHNRFLEGDKEGVEAAKEGLEGIKKYSESATKVAQWADRIRGVVKIVGPGEEEVEEDELMELLQGKSTLSEGLEHVNQMLSAAGVIADIVGIGHDPKDSIDRTVDEMDATMSAIGVGLSFVKAVPFIGDLWNKYYLPLTQACLRGIKVLARYQDEQNRQWAYVDKSSTPAGQVPMIPQESLANFPGGQEVFDYMYRLVNNMGPRMNEDVSDWFLDHREILQAGEKDETGAKDEIDVEGGSVWWDPFTYGDKETSAGLEGWLERHRDTVWAELYGNIPKHW